MDIRFLGAHNAESRTTSYVCILIDGVLAIDAGGLTSNLSISEQYKLEAILLTHQHYDHIRDIPAIALNVFQRDSNLNIYATACVLKAIETHMFNGFIYPQFQKLPASKPNINLNVIKPHEPKIINGYRVLPIPVNHFENTVGYQVEDRQGKTLFYTSDTGAGLSDGWKHTSPQTLIIDVTLPDSHKELAHLTRHLTPDLLKQELLDFKEQKGYLPQVVAIHMSPELEHKIKEELSSVANDLHVKISLARENGHIVI